jgi:alkylhydroperoxidase family enzyme
MASHTVLARQFGATDQMLETLDDLERSPLPEPERRALRFAETMAKDHGELGRDDVEQLRQDWNDDQIVEIATVVGLFSYLNRFAEAMGLWPTRPGEGGPEDSDLENEGPHRHQAPR